MKTATADTAPGGATRDRPELGIEWEHPFLPRASAPELASRFRSEIGAVPRFLPYLASNAWVARAALFYMARRRAYLDQELLELASLVASQENACRYCYGLQRSGLRTLGYGDREITNLAEARELAELSPARRVVLQLARALSRSNPRPGRDMLDGLVDAGHSPEAVAELVAYVSLTCFGNRLLTFLAVPAQADLERLTGGLLGVFTAPFVRRRFFKPTQSPLPAPLEADGPYGALLSALGRSPVAASVRYVLTEARASDVLPERALPLALAVVARAVGCDFCETSAREELVTQHLDGATCDRVLDTLSVRELEPIEAEIVTFARESVWYVPAAMQRRTSRMTERFGARTAIEVASIAALANAMVRLATLVPWSRPPSH